MILENESLKARIVNEGVILPEELEMCLKLQETCRFLELDIPLSHIILEKFGNHPMIWEKLLRLYITEAGELDIWKDGKVPCVPPEEEEAIIPKIKEESRILPEDIKISLDMERNINRMGLSLTTIEILIARNKLKWEKIRPLIKQKPRIPDKKFHKLTVSSGERTNSEDWVHLVIENGLATQEEIENCRKIQNEFVSEQGPIITLEELLYEKLLIDRSLIASLIQNQLKVKYEAEIEKLKRRRLTSEGIRTLLKTIAKEKWLSSDEILDTRSLQGTLEENYGLSICFADLLFLQGRLTNEQIISLNLPYEESEEKLDCTIKCSPNKRSLGDIALVSAVITPQQLAECLKIQEQCKTHYNIKMNIGEVFLAKGYINLITLKALLITEEYLNIKYQLESNLIQFSPDENTIILDRLNKDGRITPSLLAQVMAQQKKLLNHGLSWSISKLLLANKVISRKEITDIIGLRKTVPEVEYLIFPGWIRGDDRDMFINNLAVANRYITPEESLESIEIKKHFDGKWNLELPLPFILFKKGYIDIPTLNSLLFAQHAFSIYEKWCYEIDTLDLNRGEELWFLERLERYGLLNREGIEECQGIQRILKEQGFKLSVPKLLLYRHKVPVWALKEAIPEKTNDYAHSSVLSIPRPPDPRKAKVIPRIERKKWERTVLSGILFGQIATEEGYISKEDLDMALTVQQSLQEMGISIKTGDLLVLTQKLSASNIKPILTSQARQLVDLVWPEAQEPEGEDIWLKKFLLNQRLLPKSEIERCIFISNKLKEIGVFRRLYQIIHARDILPPETLSTIDREISKYREESASKETAREEAIKANLLARIKERHGTREEIIIETSEGDIAFSTIPAKDKIREEIQERESQKEVSLLIKDTSYPYEDKKEAVIEPRMSSYSVDEEDIMDSEIVSLEDETMVSFDENTEQIELEIVGTEEIRPTFDERPKISWQDKIRDIGIIQAEDSVEESETEEDEKKTQPIIPPDLDEKPKISWRDIIGSEGLIQVERSLEEDAETEEDEKKTQPIIPPGLDEKPTSIPGQHPTKIETSKSKSDIKKPGQISKDKETK